MIDIILLEPENEGNVGAVARVMANFGFKNLILISPKCVLSEDFSKRAKHAKSKSMVKIKIVKKFPKYDLLIGTTSKINTDYNLTRTPIQSEDVADKILPYIKKHKVAILFGRESSGLTNQEIEKCDFICTINSSKLYPALNLSHSVAILLYELYKKYGVEKVIEIEMANKKDLKRIQDTFNEIICVFDLKHKEVIQKKIWRNIFSRAIPTKREAFGMLGLLNKIKQRIKKV
jgi:tRNA/rRNA methyltransferase